MSLITDVLGFFWDKGAQLLTRKKPVLEAPITELKSEQAQRDAEAARAAQLAQLAQKHGPDKP